MGKDDFDSLFDDEPSSKIDKKDVYIPFDEPLEKDIAPAQDFIADSSSLSETRRRSSDDFELDMDALLITSQSSLIIEAMQQLTKKEFSSKTLAVYNEAMKGVDLYIKILERNPNNYNKLSKIINIDQDCKEVERIAFHLYKSKHSDMPTTDDQKLKSFELLRMRLAIAHDKAMVSTSMVLIKNYFMLSGGLDQDKISQMVIKNSQQIKNDVAILHQHLQIGQRLIKTGNYEIAQGLKGRDLNTFIIRTTQLLAYYYLTTGNAKAEEAYRRLHENYKRYFVIR
jgi:hypothetical protein